MAAGGIGQGYLEEHKRNLYLAGDVVRLTMMTMMINKMRSSANNVAISRVEDRQKRLTRPFALSIRAFQNEYVKRRKARLFCLKKQ